jgi:hypothetical protein
MYMSSSVQMANCGCTDSNPFTTRASTVSSSFYFYKYEWNHADCAPTASDKVCTMGCACNKVALTCDDFCESSAGGVVDPIAWYPYVYISLSPSSTWSAWKYVSIADSGVPSNWKKTSGTDQKYLYDWVEDAQMKDACINGTSCVCVCVAAFIHKVLCASSPPPPHHRVYRQRPLRC